VKIFSDTTPIIALSAIGQLKLLPALFGQIHAVEAVWEECAVGGKIAVPDLKQLEWVIRVMNDSLAQPVSPLLFELDRGERDTLHFAMTMKADRVLLDESWVATSPSI
jgi:hypothetical protein